MPASSLDPPVFDRSRLVALTVGDFPLQQELAASFLRESKSMRAGLEQSCEAGGEAYADALHRLQSSAHFVGGQRLLEMLRALALAGTGTHAQARRRAVALVSAQLHLLEEALRAFTAPR